MKNNREQNKEISGIFCQDNLISNIVAMSYIKKWEQDPECRPWKKKKLQKKISFVSLLLTILIMVVDTAPIINKTLDKEGML